MLSIYGCIASLLINLGCNLGIRGKQKGKDAWGISLFVSALFRHRALPQTTTVQKKIIKYEKIDLWGKDALLLLGVIVFVPEIYHGGCVIVFSSDLF